MSKNSSASTPAIDVVDYLTAQHEAIKTLFVETLDAGDADTQREAFTRLRTMLAVHETAEEMFVHPRARRKLEEAGAVIDARLTEEHDSKVVLQKLENIPHGSAEFSKTLIHLQAAVLKHAELEETEEFTLLRDELDATELRKLTAAVKVAESIAPTHPHPGVEIEPGELRRRTDRVVDRSQPRRVTCGDGLTVTSSPQPLLCAVASKPSALGARAGCLRHTRRGPGRVVARSVPPVRPRRAGHRAPPS